MLVIPAMDIHNGRVVRLSQGDFSRQVTYSIDPVTFARQCEDAGLTHLHIVDLDGARGGAPVNVGIVEDVARATRLSIDFGGGIKSWASLKRVLDAGARQVTCGSIAVTEPKEVEAWLAGCGADVLILGADASRGFIATHGWESVSTLPVEDFVVDFLALGFRTVIATDIAHDGMLSGPSYGMYRRLQEVAQNRSLPLHLIASGGVSSLEDITRLAEDGLYGVITGKALYEGRFSLAELGALQESLRKGR